MPPKKLLDQVRDAVRLKHYSYHTEQAYVDWIKRFILFHKKRHPAQMGEAQVQAFLAYLATERKVSASTQNQALCAILFLYRHLLGKELALPPNLIRAKRPSRLPTVMTKEEAVAVIAEMSGTTKLMAGLLYGSGLRLTLAPRWRAAQVQVWNVCACG